MRTATRCAVFLLLLAIGACAPAEPRYGSVAAAIPPLPQGMARVYLYRWLEPYETVAPATVSLNDQPVGVSETGAVLYRDVTPGRYTISVQSRGTYPDQFKTVSLTAGEIAYARLESLRSWCGAGNGGEGAGGGAGCYDTFVVRIIDPQSAQTEMRDLRFIRG